MKDRTPHILDGYVFLILGVVGLLFGVGALFFVWNLAVTAAINETLQVPIVYTFITYGSILGTFSVLLGILSMITAVTHFLTPRKRR